MRRPSGLWHQKQLREQPLRKTVVRMPGPSWIENRCMLKTMPVELMGVDIRWKPVSVAPGMRCFSGETEMVAEVLRDNTG